MPVGNSFIFNYNYMSLMWLSICFPFGQQGRCTFLHQQIFECGTEENNIKKYKKNPISQKGIIKVKYLLPSPFLSQTMSSLSVEQKKTKGNIYIYIYIYIYIKIESGKATPIKPISYI